MKKISYLVLLLQAGLIHAQVGLRSGVTIKKDFGKKISLSATAQARFINNFEYLENRLFEIGASYEIIKNLDLGVYYRYAQKKRNSTEVDLRKRHRYYADLAYSKKWGAWQASYRLRYQHQFKDNDGEVKFDQNYFRNKLELGYEASKKIKPYTSVDVFYAVGGQIDQLRPKIGVDLKINKQNKIDLSVFKDIDLINSTKYNPVLGVAYKYTFK